MKINNFLQIKSEEDSIKYQFEGFKKYQVTFTRIFFIITLLQICVVVINIVYI